MINIEKQISFWLEGAEEELIIAKTLFSSNKIRHSLFFLHLAIEKILKAHVSKITNDIPPRTHNLIRLSELSNLTLTDEILNFLAKMNIFNIEGRYPENNIPLPSRETVEAYISKTEEVMLWLKKLL